MASPIHRRLGATEHFVWLRDAYCDRQGDHPSALHFVLTAQISGPLQVDALPYALEQLQHRYPLLRVAIVPDREGHPHFIEQSAAIPYQVLPRRHAQQWQQAVAQILAQPLHPAIAPLVRILLYQGKDQSDLLLVCHHSIADGLTGVALMRDLLTLLGNAPGGVCTTPALPPPLEAFWPSLAPVSWWETQLGRGAIALQHYRSRLTQVWARATDAPPDRTLHVEAGRLSLAMTTHLRQRCRQEGTTVQGALCAALLMAIATRQPPRQEQLLSCFSPINLRPYLPPCSDFQPGMYISPGHTEHTLTPATRFWDLARSVKTGLMAQVKPEYLRQLVQGHRVLASSRPRPDTIGPLFLKRFGADGMVTNLGRLNLSQDFGTLRLEALYGPMVRSGFTHERVLGVTTLSDQLFYTFLHHPLPAGGREGASPAAQIAAILEGCLMDGDLSLATLRPEPNAAHLVEV